jgi:hypothetical protein
MGQLPRVEAYLGFRPSRAYERVPLSRSSGTLGFHVCLSISLLLHSMLMDRMETQTISAREAVARQVETWWGLGLGECRGGADAWDWSCEE